MKNLIIIGASDWGIEVFSWLDHLSQFNREWKFKGFLDDNLGALDGKKGVGSLRVLDTIIAYEIQLNDVFICAIANPIIKEKLVEIINRKGGEFINLIHPSVIFYKNNSIGVGNIICPYTVISNSVCLGNHIGINIGVSIGHDVEIGDFCQISSQCDLTGYVKLDKCVFLGSSVSIKPKVKVGANSYLGVGSIVLRNIKENSKVFGNPAKKITL